MAEVLIGLGGNEGNVADAFHTALTRLARSGMTLVDVSPYAESHPVTLGSEAGQPYLNAAASFESSYEPVDVLRLLQSAEGAAGRTRAHRWGPRPLDLDLLFYGDQIIETPDLIIPHPAAWYRRFVLDPLVEIAPEFVHPEKGLTLRQLRERLLVRPITIGLSGWQSNHVQHVAQQLNAPAELVRVSDWRPGDVEPTLLIFDGSPKQALEQGVPIAPLVGWWPQTCALSEFVRILAESAVPELQADTGSAQA
jgi:2-amino-4-hydroxy-6-hydroxymethyldihydropteridine diphosphokinase